MGYVNRELLKPLASNQYVPESMPSAQPAITAERSGHFTKRARKTAGRVCRIHTPPASWSVIAYWVRPGMRMKPTAPTFTNKETILETCASSRGLAAGRTNSTHTLRQKRLAAAIDITEAGTKAPMAMAANAKPANQPGKANWMSCGTALLAPYGGRGLMPAA